IKTLQQEVIETELNDSNIRMQEIINTLINHTQASSNTQSLYVFEEKDDFIKFALPLLAYHNWIKEDEKIDYLIHKLTLKILPDYQEEIIQYEMGIGRMSPHQKIIWKFEINSISIDENSIFRLDESTFIIRSTEGEGDYTIQKTGDKQTTYLLPDDNDIQTYKERTNNNIIINDMEKQINEINCHIDQWVVRIGNLLQKIDLNNVPLEKKREIVIKLEE
ncbi:6224_t:CDS:2, partial [Racocetra fulgida]